MPEGDCS